MLITSQCLDLKSQMEDVRCELRMYIFIVLLVSLLKIVYYHLFNQYHVRKIKQLLEVKRPFSNPAVSCSFGSLPDLPKIDRVQQHISMRRRSSIYSNPESPVKEKGLQRASPPSRSYIKSSTSERTETSPCRRKNQIVASEILL